MLREGKRALNEVLIFFAILTEASNARQSVNLPLRERTLANPSS
jgi:hypothetical protein